MHTLCFVPLEQYVNQTRSALGQLMERSLCVVRLARSTERFFKLKFEHQHLQTTRRLAGEHFSVELLWCKVCLHYDETGK